tara:strand:+ start:166 stop:444 length:279 start_codon:yes stop_codon:yes gene_type:complete
MKKKPNKAMREAYKRVAEKGCIVCKVFYNCYSECEIHHLTGAGMGLRSQNFVGLCPRHHRGQDGVHHNTKKFEERFGSQESLLKYYDEVLSD